MRMLAQNQFREVVFDDGKFRLVHRARNHHTLPDGAVVADFELGRVSALRVIREIEGREDLEGCDDE